MSRTTQGGVFILLKVIKRHEEKRPESRTELTKLETTMFFLGLFLPSNYFTFQICWVLSMHIFICK